MQTAAECDEMADQCEQQAATVANPVAHELLREVAAEWRALADDLKAEETFGRQAGPPASN